MVLRRFLGSCCFSHESLAVPPPCPLQKYGGSSVKQPATVFWIQQLACVLLQLPSLNNLSLPGTLLGPEPPREGPRERGAGCLAVWGCRGSLMPGWGRTGTHTAPRCAPSRSSPAHLVSSLRACSKCFNDRKWLRASGVFPLQPVLNSALYSAFVNTWLSKSFLCSAHQAWGENVNLGRANGLKTERIIRIFSGKKIRKYSYLYFLMSYLENIWKMPLSLTHSIYTVLIKIKGIPKQQFLFALPNISPYYRHI